MRSGAQAPPPQPVQVPTQEAVDAEGTAPMPSLQELQMKLKEAETKLAEKDELLRSKDSFIIPEGMSRDDCRKVFKAIETYSQRKHGNRIFVIENVVREWDREEGKLPRKRVKQDE